MINYTGFIKLHKCILYSVCTSNVTITDSFYQNKLLVNAADNILVLAKKLQDKHTKSKMVIFFCFDKFSIENNQFFFNRIQMSFLICFEA
jgi:hypothetical protein